MDLRALYSSDKEQYLKELKCSVVEHTITDAPPDYKELVDEWNRSLKTTVLQNHEFLTAEQRDFHVFERVDDLAKYRLAYLDDFYTGREGLLAELNCAIFYLDSELATFRRKGDEALLAELKEKGLRLGTTFSQRNVGVFVANMAQSSPFTTICRVGQENYLELFTDYVCFAHYGEEDYRGFRGVNLVLAPVRAYTKFLKTAVSFLLDVEDVTHQISYPFAKKYYHLITEAAYKRDEMAILLDEQANVIFANEAFEKRFGKKVAKGPEENVSQFMPELTFLKKYLRNIPIDGAKEVMLTNADGKHHFYYVSSELLRDGNRVDGLKCMLRTAEQKKTSAFTALGQETRYTFDSIIGESKKLCELKRVGESAAQNASNVLILGESGTGKEMVAQAIHAANGDRKGPFVPINCAALPKELLSSELFGYEEGAFTGALKGGHAGKFEQADGGTVFLDEIAEMPLEMQSALLRVLEDGVVSRIGGKRYIPLDVRVIAATNKDLWSCVQQGSFRTDLYFRLNIVSIRLPPLRERLEDMKMLVEHLLGQLSEKGMSRAVGADEDVLGLLCEYNWPGNVRELRNVLERSANAAGSDTLTLETIPADIIALLTGAGSASAGEMPRDVIVDVASWRRSDKDRIAALMGKYNGNKSKVASELGVSRGTLYKRLREFGLED